MMKMRKSNLDEQQELTLLRIESTGYWMAFWGTLIVLIINVLFVKNTISLMSSWTLFMILAVYVGVSCARAGIWDRRLDMSNKTMTLVSAAAALCSGLVMAVSAYMRSGKPVGSIAAGVFQAGVVFAVCWFALRVSARAVKKRQDELNAEPDDTMNE